DRWVCQTYAPTFREGQSSYPHNPEVRQSWKSRPKNPGHWYRQNPHALQTQKEPKSPPYASCIGQPVDLVLFYECNHDNPKLICLPIQLLSSLPPIMQFDARERWSSDATTHSNLRKTRS